MLFCGGSTPLANGFVQPYLSPETSLAQYAAWLKERIEGRDAAVWTQLGGIKAAQEIVSGAEAPLDHGPLVAQAWQGLQVRGGLRPRPRLYPSGDGPKSGEVWVFAANLAGQLSTASAKLAQERFGARPGHWGYQGRAPAHSYALPTKDAKRTPLPFADLVGHVHALCAFINQRPDLCFFIDRLGADLGPTQERALVALFRQANLNRCAIPAPWAATLSPPSLTYAGLGTPDTPDEVQRLMQRTATRLAHLGLCLRTTPMAGAHSAWLAGTIGSESWRSQTTRARREVYLPWPNYAHHPHAVLSAASGVAEQIARVMYPAYGTCGVQERALLALHSHLVLGVELSRPVDVLVCWSPEGAQTEDEADVSTPTGLAIGLAHRWNIPVFNLQRSGRVAALFAYLHTQGLVKTTPVSKWMSV